MLIRDILTPMSYLKELVFSCIMLFAIVQLSPLFAVDSELSRGSLAGLTSFGVLVEDLSPGATRLGLTREAIQTDVELKLRLAGIRIASTDLDGYLHIAASVTDDGTSACIQVEMLQYVVLARKMSISILAPTWSEGTVTKNYTAQQIRSVIKDNVDKFLNAWLSVNPKQ